jgi:DNA-binding NtrC family response regulator
VFTLKKIKKQHRIHQSDRENIIGLKGLAGMKNSKKILVIDDDKDFGTALKFFFAGKDVELHVAHTLTEGMTLLEKEKPEYIFLDNNLPDGLGWGKTEYILSHYPQIHLNLISALDVPKTSTSTFRILEKPVSLDEILSCLDNNTLGKQ